VVSRLDDPHKTTVTDGSRRRVVSGRALDPEDLAVQCHDGTVATGHVGSP